MGVAEDMGTRLMHVNTFAHDFCSMLVIHLFFFCICSVACNAKCDCSLWRTMVVYNLLCFCAKGMPLEAGDEDAAGAGTEAIKSNAGGYVDG